MAVLIFIVWLVVLLKPILTPFIAAAVLAYMLNPLVERLCRRRVRRPIAAMAVMLFALLLIVVLLIMIIPMLIAQFQNMLEKLPQFVLWINDIALPRLNAFFGTAYTLDTSAFAQLWEENSSVIKTALGKLMPTLAKQSGNVLAVLINLMLLPFLLYYFLLDWNRWAQGVKRLIPRRFITTAERIMYELDQVLSEFLRGQLMVMLVVGAIYGLGLSLVGLDNGFAIGMVAGILVFIPYLGSFTGLLLATVAAILQFNAWSGLLMVWGVFAVGQFLESFIITPRIIGERIGLSPLAVIFALMAFGQLMGFVGMLLALPMAAICVVLFREGMEAYFASNLYRDNQENSCKIPTAQHTPPAPNQPDQAA
ncbi:MAG: AI-2E family transporter [Neisseria sp.]|nr:AI-2E family transporter [Neisseria sp.]